MSEQRCMFCEQPSTHECPGGYYRAAQGLACVPAGKRNAADHAAGDPGKRLTSARGIPIAKPGQLDPIEELDARIMRELRG